MREGTLESLKERFEAWRRRKRTGELIPAELLNAAKGLVGRYRAGTLARVLRVHYRRLAPGVSGGEKGVGWIKGVEGGGGEKGLRFVKWRLERPDGLSGDGEGRGWVEIEDPRGYKARIYRSVPVETIQELLKGIAGVDR